MNNYAKIRQIDKQRELKDQIPELIIPVQEGYDHINLDLCFSFLGNWDITRLENINTSICLCELWKLRQSEYLLKGSFAFIVNANKSRNARSMGLFTDVNTNNRQELDDLTEKRGFSIFSMKKKGRDERT